MKRVLTYGVFDLFHFGHLRFFQNAKKHGDYLIVAVQRTNDILRYKPDCKILYNTEERVEMLQSLRVVDEVVEYSDVFESIQTIDFEVFAKGPDQIHEGIMKSVDYCRKNGKEVVEIQRTDGISSTYIKNLVDDLS